MRRIRARRDDDRGAIALFVIVFTVALLAAVGLVVDGGGKVRALQRADEAAREAARAGSQMLDIPSAVRGDGVSIDPAAAARAARAYLDAARIDGTVTVEGNTVQVSTSVTYQPVFLGVAGVGPLTVTGTASARPVTGDDEEVP
jgi:Flp pilus assembly protein TadG